MQRSVFYVFILIMLLLASCSRRPRYVLNERKMVDVLSDIHLAQAIYNNADFRSDEKKDALIEGVLKKHKITQAELDSSLYWYSDNMEYYTVITDSVAARLRSWQTRLSNERNLTMNKARKDYLIPPSYILTENAPTMSFDIDSTKIKNLDLAKFRLSFNVQGLNKLQSVDASVYYTYQDTAVHYTIPVNNNAVYVIEKPQLADSLLKSITGYIHLSNRVGLPSNIILYNINYSDSISVSKLADVQEEKSITSPPKREEANQKFPERRESLRTTDSLIKKEPVIINREDLPVIPSRHVNRAKGLSTEKVPENLQLEENKK